MNHYSIKDIEKFTGIKAHTLRIWEQRFSLLEPKRTETNIRYYSNEDVRKALNINLLYSNGWKISKIAALSPKEFEREISKVIGEESELSENSVDIFIKYVLEFKELEIRKEFDKICTDKDFTEAYAEVIVPLLMKVGELWQSGSISVAHEHFLSNLLREFILTKTAELPDPADGNKRAVLFLHEKEVHELGLLSLQYELKKLGFICFYLGAAVPMSDLKKFVQQIKPDYMFSSFIGKINKANFLEIFKQISTYFDLKNLYVSGFQVKEMENYLPKSVVKIHKINEIEKLFNKN